jgi:hypothetical protein
VGQPALPDGVVEIAGQRGDAAADGHWAAAGRQLGADELIDVLMGQLLETHGAEGRQQVVS